MKLKRQILNKETIKGKDTLGYIDAFVYICTRIFDYFKNCIITHFLIYIYNNYEKELIYCDYRNFCPWAWQLLLLPRF